MLIDALFEILTTGADISQFISLSKSLRNARSVDEILENQKAILALLSNNKGEIDCMKILKDLIQKADDTLEEIEWYAEKAYHLKPEHKSLADTYIKIAEMHISIYNMLHDRMVDLIDEERKKGVAVPAAMTAIWDYEHEKLVKEFSEAKYMVEEYKKLGY